MKKLGVLLLLLSGPAGAADNCVLQDRTVNINEVVVDQRSTIERRVTTHDSGDQICHVRFSVRIGDQWYPAEASYQWPGTSSSAEACAVAVYRAEENIRAQVGETRIQNQRVLTCQDHLPPVPVAAVGQLVRIEQLRPHPSYLEDFYHRGTRCRWFVDTQFQNQNIHTYQGIMCETGQGWVVVDKF